MKTHLVFAVMTALLLAFVISQSGQKTVTFDNVVGIAQGLSSEDYQAPPKIAAPLRALNYDQTRDIRFKEDQTLWRKEGLPFQVRFFFAAGGGDAHSPMPVTVYQVNRDSARQVRFSPEQFTFGPLVKLSPEDEKLGQYSGFRLYYPVNKPDVLDEALVFQGASYFRPLAKSQQYGLSARGITIDSLGKEDFPNFTQFWLVKPSAGASEIVLYALLEGRDLTGAYEFRVAPGPESKIHVRAVLFPRLVKKKNGEITKRTIKEIGYAPLTSMYWYGENTSNTFGGWRPEVHDSDGLQMQRGNGEWIWHPLSWAKQRQVNVFSDQNPKGFGLFQRDRDFTHYQDLEANYHLRPSAWVQPDGDWGAGSVVLMQNATSNEFDDNVVAYWRPEGGLTGRSEIAYALTAFTKNGSLPPLGACISTRIDYQDKPNFRKIVLTFSGGDLNNLPADTRPTPDIWIDKTGILSDVQVQQIPGTKDWQITFGVTASDVGNPVEMLCTLRRDGKPLTETWSYTWVK
jgi:glucans biosynthesis protein